MRIASRRLLPCCLLIAAAAATLQPAIAQQTWDGTSPFEFGPGQNTLERRLPWRGEELRTKLQSGNNGSLGQFTSSERRICPVRTGPSAASSFIEDNPNRTQVEAAIAQLKQFASGGAIGTSPVFFAISAMGGRNYFQDLSPNSRREIPYILISSAIGESINTAALTSGQPLTFVVRYRCLAGNEISAYALALVRVLENYYGIAPAGQ